MARRTIDERGDAASEHSAHRAIVWGAVVMLFSLATGFVLAWFPLAPQATFLELPFNLGVALFTAAFGVSVIGLGMVVYGLVQILRARHHEHHRAG